MYSNWIVHTGVRELQFSSCAVNDTYECGRAVGCVSCERTFSGECIDCGEADACEYAVYEFAERRVAGYDDVRVARTCWHSRLARVAAARRVSCGCLAAAAAVQHEVDRDRLAAQLCTSNVAVSQRTISLQCSHSVTRSNWWSSNSFTSHSAVYADTRNVNKGHVMQSRVLDQGPEVRTTRSRA